MLSAQVILHVENTSTLGIGQWPRLSYQPRRVCPEPNVGVARGHPREAAGGQAEQNPFSHTFMGTVHLQWSPDTLYTPALTWRTTFLACALPWLRIPALPPGCAVEMVTDALHGHLDDRGACALLYDARYVFRVMAGVYTSPELRVKTLLTTDGPLGACIDSSGRARLAGAATIEPTGGWLCDTLLSLPTECSTCLDVRFEIL